MNVPVAEPGPRDVGRLVVTVYSDFLCPWCWPAAERLRHLRDEFLPRIALQHRAYVLVPDEKDRTFTEYHLQHREAARAQSSLPFDLPKVGAPYPRSSWPAQEAAKWVEAEYPEFAQEYELGLFEAFFRDTRDISSPEVLADVARQHDLEPDSLLAALSDHRYRDAVMADHRSAIERGIRAVPTALIGGQSLAGAVPYEAYAQAARDGGVNE